MKPTGASTTAPTSMSLPEAQEAQVFSSRRATNVMSNILSNIMTNILISLSFKVPLDHLDLQVDGQNKQPNGTILHSTLYKQTGNVNVLPIKLMRGCNTQQVTCITLQVKLKLPPAPLHPQCHCRAQFNQRNWVFLASRAYWTPHRR